MTEGAGGSQMEVRGTCLVDISTLIEALGLFESLCGYDRKVVGVEKSSNYRVTLDSVLFTFLYTCQSTFIWVFAEHERVSAVV